MKGVRIECATKRDGWDLISNYLSPEGDFELNENMSQRAGYKVFVNHNTNEWVSDLETRLELNLRNGNTINLWIGVQG